MSWECLELPRIAWGGVSTFHRSSGEGRRGGASSGAGEESRVSNGVDKGLGYFSEAERCLGKRSI